MQTNLAAFIKDTPQGSEAEAILRSCVHCGFCNATCPTYQLLGDELDGPRGRIYQIKQVLEGNVPSHRTQLHLDRCLTCRACETTCPSGVHYSRLLDIGRALVHTQVKRKGADSVFRSALRTIIPHRQFFAAALRAGRLLRPMLPAALQRKIPSASPPPKPWPAGRHTRTMLVLEGCVQPALAPETNAAAARVLDRMNISLLRAKRAGCCGAVSLHLDAADAARDYARRNIDAWWPHVENGAEAIVMTASGCGVMVKDYGHLLAEDAAYAGKAQRVAGLTKDIAEILIAEQDQLVQLLAQHAPSPPQRVAFHAPCTLQHGLKLGAALSSLLSKSGFDLLPVRDSHLCCGSAGTYSILQPELSQRLLGNKITALTAGSPQTILTANIGCQSHLQGATTLPVRHWIAVLDDRLS